MSIHEYNHWAASLESYVIQIIAALANHNCHLRQSFANPVNEGITRESESITALYLPIGDELIELVQATAVLLFMDENDERISKGYETTNNTWRKIDAAARSSSAEPTGISVFQALVTCLSDHATKEKYIGIGETLKEQATYNDYLERCRERKASEEQEANTPAALAARLLEVEHKLKLAELREAHAREIAGLYKDSPPAEDDAPTPFPPPATKPAPPWLAIVICITCCFVARVAQECLAMWIKHAESAPQISEPQPAAIAPSEEVKTLERIN
jgi:hypothetical protein